MYKFLLLLCFAGMLTVARTVRAQELNCDVTLNNDLVEDVALTYVTELSGRIKDYFNDYKWTDIDFEEHERIKCQMQIVIESGSKNYNFSARVVFSLRRPIYNTTSETTAIIITDNSWRFNYPQGRTLLHDELQFDDLTSLLDYLAYMALGYDFDSFSPLGGTPYFRKAQNIVDLAQTGSASGWLRSSNNRRNRNTLVSDLLNAGYQPLRNAFYVYHRKGLDLFTTNDREARANILTALEEVRDAKRRSTSNYLYDVFFDTKARELAGVFEEAEPQVKLRAYNVLIEADQGHISEYSGLQN